MKKFLVALAFVAFMTPVPFAIAVDMNIAGQANLQREQLAAKKKLDAAIDAAQALAVTKPVQKAKVKGRTKK